MLFFISKDVIDQGGAALVGFVILYILTFLPCWFAVFKIVKSIKAKKYSLFLLWAIILFVLLALPYLYVAIIVYHGIWQIVVLIAVISIVSVYKLIVNREKTIPTWLWNWYARSYDYLKKFKPYHDLIIELSHVINKNARQKTNILDMGCGTGNLLFELSKDPILNCVGVDSSPYMIKIAQNKKYSNNNVTIIEADIEHPININRKFDVVVLNNVLYTINNFNELLGRIPSLLEDNGIVVLSEPLKGSSIFKLLLSHYKRNTFFAMVDTARYFFPLLMIFIANIIISMEAGNKRAVFFTQDELVSHVKSAGLIIKNVNRLYEEQNVCVVAVKKIIVR